MLRDPEAVFRGRAITGEEKKLLSGLTAADFATVELLCEATGQAADELAQYVDHPVARLRHF